MKKVGLTGGIGSGKSTVARMLADEGFPVVDADQIAREIMEPGSPVLAQVAEVFGEDLIDDTGALNRAELAKRAFSSTEQTEKLNALTHPAIRAESNRRFDEAEKAGARAVIYDMPLLVDLGLHHDMDMTVVVDVDVDERVRRLVDKRGLTEADARARIAQQVDDDTRRAAADIVVDNNGPLEALAAQVEKVVRMIDA
ncbi:MULTISPECIES: dephospho-CoA kinase [Corynebacterium]|uniref:Dephospho-CoA kinase n=1 Tax=Corynebacterium coyleae TaxID=53374 RepID=A0AAP7CD27_9CORY|nr:MULTISPECIES: dephospho-CoA kinase [Corynebacterium]MDK6493642.1 dephospho-CoA kinase [Corynebacterium coyleae]MDK8241468.1 dephospho-CoA kinase [Corynebacterium coyleae]MDK8663348.1 dephospho-CoA kinase [Corynebacterium coyleae]MDK8706306.1 dephospho-CoA kinase [Corynebacterium coyleae]MDK8733303.1 dephospho-CoA kinase [Corynebacterium coyleae]